MYFFFPSVNGGAFLFKAVGYSEILYGFHLALEVSGLRPTTIRHYISDTKKFLEYYSEAPPLEITTTHIRKYLDNILLIASISTPCQYESGYWRSR
ncbi:hypothetical protein FIM08_01415 [SAR202 cluster bacterium AC-647-N09_OGT_505m]|nr:hypothetical protein [SAR202 cluster bacterium AC-647-N09_OGT_505m]